MAKTKSVVKSANVVELESLRSEMKVLRERMKFVASLVKEEKIDAKLSRSAAARNRKAETIAKLKAKLAALEAA
jgi:hypothetical protein